MPVSDAFRDFVVEQLSRCAPAVRFKRMFGGGGLYSQDRIFGLLDDDALYLKGDAESRARYLDAGMLPFSPFGDPAQVMAYYAVPGDVLEDVEQLQPWVALALEVAGRAGKKAKRASAAPANAGKAVREGTREPATRTSKAARKKSAAKLSTAKRHAGKKSSTKPRRPRA